MKLKDCLDLAVQDSEDFLEKTRHDLERWTELLAKLDGFRASLIETVVQTAFDLFLG